MAKYSTINLYATDLRQEFVEIPQNIINFFKKHKQYVNLPKKDDKTNIKKRITYRNITGKDAKNVPRCYETDREYEDIYTYPVKNKTKSAKKDAERICCNALASLFKRRKQEFKIRKRDYMIHTSSTPIKIQYNKNRNKVKWPVYAKKPDTARILGRFLYDIICEYEMPEYTFNRTVFLEDSIKGHTVDEVNEEFLLKNEDYIDGIIRANCHADFLEVYSDVLSPRNRIVAGFDTILFDFNLLFNKRPIRKELSVQDVLLKRYHKKHPKIFTLKRVKEIYAEEREAIVKRAEKHRHFFDFIKIMNDVKDMTKSTFREKLKESYNAESFEEFFEKKLKYMPKNHIKNLKKIFS